MLLLLLPIPMTITGDGLTFVNTRRVTAVARPRESTVVARICITRTYFATRTLTKTGSPKFPVNDPRWIARARQGQMDLYNRKLGRDVACTCDTSWSGSGDCLCTLSANDRFDRKTSEIITQLVSHSNYVCFETIDLTLRLFGDWERRWRQRRRGFVKKRKKRNKSKNYFSVSSPLPILLCLSPPPLFRNPLETYVKRAKSFSCAERLNFVNKNTVTSYYFSFQNNKLANVYINAHAKVA
jgi:hypothetical protein